MGKIKSYLKRVFRRYWSPSFVVALVLAFIMWYVAKLNYNYTVRMSMTVTIEDTRFRVPTVVEGSGRRILAHRYLMRNNVKIKRGEVELLPVEDKPDTYTISVSSLQNAISVRNGDLRVVSVGTPPEITLKPAKK